MRNVLGLMVMVAVLGLAACERRKTVFYGDPVPAPTLEKAPENVSGVWTGSYTIKYHTGETRTYALTLSMEQPPRGGVIDGTWNNGKDILPLIGARATGSGAFIQAIGSNASGSNPFRHYSYVVDARFPDSTFKTLEFTVKGNDYKGGIVSGSGTVSRP